jgi:3-dehydroquinate dehydratase II
MECFVAKILVIHGPNLNLLGQREPSIYGSQTLAEINESLKNQAESAGHRIDFLQSNAEHELIDAVQRAKADGVDAILINPAAFTEAHLSNPHSREPFRQHSYLSDLAAAVICGFGANSYYFALAQMLQWFAATPSGSQP